MGLKTTLNEKKTDKNINFMKKIKFISKPTNTEKVIMGGKVGECVFAVCQNVKETNDAIRWCNQHKVGDKFDCNAYTLEIIEE